MIADSSYEFNELIMPAWLGALWGMLAAATMLGFLYLLQPFPQLSVVDLLARMGAVFWPESLAPGVNLVILGGVVHAVLGALFGLLYALCQQQTTLRNLIAVALFYGLMLWLIGLVLVSPWLDQTLKPAVRSWPWLWGCLVYGLVLAGSAIWMMARNPVQVMVPKD